jgi:adenine-specific DNA-methyltransferase
MAKEKKKSEKSVEAFKHDDATRKNIPTAEYQSMHKDTTAAKELRYPRNADLDPQLVWRGKDQQNESDLVVPTPELFIQEKVHPKALIDDLLKTTKEKAHQQGTLEADLFADFDGLPKDADKTEFYQHDANWSNRMILGDSLQVMASLAEREGLRGKVQCVYFDPPYGIRFNSNFQWSTTSRDVKDGNAEHITREPEQVKAFRDTWRDGIHSYLTYLRDRLIIARDLLTDTGSIFVQIGDENVHHVRELMDEVFGTDNFVSLITFKKTTGLAGKSLTRVSDYLVWYAKDISRVKYRQIFQSKTLSGDGATHYNKVMLKDGMVRSVKKEEVINISELPEEARVYEPSPMISPGNPLYKFEYNGQEFSGTYKTNKLGLGKLAKAGRLEVMGSLLRYRRFLNDYPVYPISNIWEDILGIQSRSDPKIYVVQTSTSAIERCIIMTTDPGDIVLDPTCGSGTTAMVSEQWGRRWITIDTSRVALALARSRVMGAKYPFYLLADSRDGQLKEGEVTHTMPSDKLTYGNLRHGFVYERVPHIMLSSISNNTEIDVIWENWQKTLEPLREKLNSLLKKSWQEWEIPREAESTWSTEAKKIHTDWWQARISRQKEIDASIAAKAEFEFLYDKPYEDKKKVRVAGPFTVESLTPHRMLGVDENDKLIDNIVDAKLGYTPKKNFAELILQNLKVAGVQQAHKEDKINFTSLQPWPGKLICAVGVYSEGDVEKRAAVFIGPEFGTVQRSDLVEAAREATDARFDVLIACAFNYDAHTTEFSKLASLPVLKARMNADLHMAEDLKNTGKGNLFVVFGEPDIDLIKTKDGMIQVKVNGVDVFKPSLGKVESSNTDEIACWFIDTDYNEESFFVRHAYFLGTSDPYNSLKTTLKAEINKEAWESLNSATSRPFPKPKSKKIAVKVINHLGDEVMKVFKVD